MEMVNEIGACSKKAVAYARTSARGGNPSLAAQIGAIHHYAKAHGLVLVGEYMEFATATNSDEPSQLRNMLRRVLEPDSGISSIIVTEPTRLTRNTSKAQALVEQLNARGIRVEFIR